MNEYDKRADRAEGEVEAEKPRETPGRWPGKHTHTDALQTPATVIARAALAILRAVGRDEQGVAPDAPAAVARAASGSGQALPGELRTRFESSLGVGLDDVRVHTGEASAHAADAVGARAYTVGKDIHFNAGEFQPGAAEGQRLIAHEVAHSVQAPAPSGGGLAVSSPGDAHEVEADRAADAMVGGAAASHTAGGAARGATLHRAEWPAWMASDKDKAEKGMADATTGLYPRQHLALNAALKHVGNLDTFSTATPTPWDTLQSNTEELATKIGAVLRDDITNYPRAKLAPAMESASALRDHIIGVTKPLPQVRQELAVRLGSAVVSMDRMRKIYIGTPGMGEPIETAEQLEERIKAGQAAADKKIPNSDVTVATDDEVKNVRARYTPMSPEKSAWVKDFSAKVKALAEKAKTAPIGELVTQTQLLLTVWNAGGEPVPPALLGFEAEVRTALEGGYALVAAKTIPLENALAMVRSRGREIRTAIQATLSLPIRHDPKGQDAAQPPRAGGLPGHYPDPNTPTTPWCRTRGGRTSSSSRCAAVRDRGRRGRA